MKKIIYIGILLLMVLIPKQALAEEKVNVYFFKQTGCPHCAEAEEFFESIEGQYNDVYNLIEYNIYESEEDYNLLQKVKKAMKEKEEGVPYIVVGKKDFLGFGEGSAQEILDAIMTEYDATNRYDIMENLEKKKSVVEDIVVVAGIVLGVVILGYVRYKNK